MTKQTIEEKEISARFSNVQSSEIGKIFPNLKKFLGLPEQKCVLRTTRGKDISGCAFIFNDEGRTHVLRFSESTPHSIYQMEPLKEWDPEATLIVLPV